MSSRNRLHFTQFGCVVLVAVSLAGASAAQSVGQANKAGPQQNSAQAPSQHSPSGVSLRCDPSEDAKSYTCYRDRPREPPTVLEHLGRWSFRLWRDPIAVLTLALFIIGGIQVELSRRTARSQLRAYVMIEGGGLIDNLTPPNPSLQGLATAVTIIKNSGVTPAHDVRHSSFITVRRLTETSLVIPPKAHLDTSAGVLAPGVSLTRTARMDRQLTPFEISEIQTGVSAIYVCGLVTYRDAFNAKHRSTYKLNYTGQWPCGMEARMNICEDHNSAD